jgi:hypothetical protein
MSLQNKIDSARASLDGTNVNADEFLKKFAALCGYDTVDDIKEDDLQDARWEDIEECGVPKIKARRISRIFREGESDEQPQKVVVDITGNPSEHAKTLTPVQLVDFYDPDNSTNPYGVKLKQDAENRRCVVFNHDGTLNRELTKQLVDEICNLKYPERPTVNVDGVPSPIFRVGDRPDRYAEENPVRPGTPLRPDGCSDKGVEWGKLPMDIRQLVYLGTSTGELKDTEIDLFEKVVNKDFAEVAKRCPNAAVKFKELENLGTLPQLKIRLGGTGAYVHGGLIGPKSNNPFTRGHRVT